MPRPRKDGSAKREFRLVDSIDAAVLRYRGDASVLESAIGTLLVGRHVGWRVLLLMHDRQTLKRYEAILGVPFREVLPDIGVLAHRSVCWREVAERRGFWKYVKSEVRGFRKTNELSDPEGL